MHTDELRREVAAMANEMKSFAGDVQVLHERRRRQRVIASIIAVTTIAGLGTIGTVAARSRDNAVVRVSSAPSKEVAPAKITRVDAIVVPPTEAVRLALDQSALVSEYALVPRAELPSTMMDTVQSKAASCALRSSDGYAVTAIADDVHLGADLTEAIGNNAKVYSLRDRFGAWDAEIFMKVDATPAETAALQTRLDHDPDIRSVRHISVNDAYDIFKEEFRDQPALVRGTKPSDLPQSFRVVLEPGRSVANFADRYYVAGVDTVITQQASSLWHVRGGAPPAASTACSHP